MRRILIVGGGYAGFYAAWELEKKLRRARPRSPSSIRGLT